MSDSETNMEGSKHDNSLKSLIRKRGGIRSRLTLFKNYIQKFKLNDSPSSLEIREITLRLSQIQELLTKFDSVQIEIEELSSNLEEQMMERDTTESEFYSQIALAQEIIDSVSSHKEDGNESTSSTSCNNSNSIKFPTINLPTFDGNYSKWLEFRDTFQSLINDNNSIAPINKFHYLRNSLSGSASTVIRSIEFTAKSYEYAWKALCDRYNNDNILVNNHFHALISINPLQRESFKALRYLIDQVHKNLNALNNLNIPTKGWDPLVIYLVAAKLDPHTSRKWEEYKGHLSHHASLEEFSKFIENRANVLETANYSRSSLDHKNPISKDSNFQNKSVKSLATVSNSSNVRLCLVCNNIGHYVYQCHAFKKMNVNDKWSEVSKHNLCPNCLRFGHTNSNCTLKGSCRICKKKHQTALHKNNITESVNNSENLSQESSDSNLPVTLSAISSGQVLLCTAQVQVMNTKTNKTYLARALLDTGSQISFITEKLKDKLGLQVKQMNGLNISGINSINCKVTEQCSVRVKSQVGLFSIQVNCFILPKITGYLPNVPVHIEGLGLPENISLADPSFYEPHEIDILLGAEHFFNIIGNNKISLGQNKPVLQESKLGWLVAGPTGDSSSCDLNVNCNFVKRESLQDINVSLKKFWEVEELSPSESSNYLIDEQYCESHFSKHTRRLPDGRFSVMIPLKEDPEHALGNSFFMARRRFLNLESRLNKNKSLSEQYSKFILEYANLGHLKEIKVPPFGYYLPHHSVIREEHETTKLRVVFDASAKTSSGKSLNDIQAIGPVVQSDLFSILIRFRIRRFVLTADVEKMYRQIAIDESQRHLQLVLWRDPVDTEVNEPIKILQLNTVTYGMASAPFLSTRCLVELANQCKDKVIANVIKNDFYIDDLNTGASSENELRHIYLGVTQTLNSACFPLRKFRTNCPDILSDKSESSISQEFHEEASVLGLKWSPTTDNLHFPSKLKAKSIVTKRTIISTTCKLFDPLGLVSCCIIKPKILLQSLWNAKLGWDDPVPETYIKKWLVFINNIHYISNIVTPRYVLNNCSDIKFAELHCFVDASQQAYGACVYMRTVDDKNNVTVRLLCAKTRVAPIKTLTIPRLELCAALTGAQLCDKVLQSIPYCINTKYMWTDSTVVLSWLKTQSKMLQVFVRNRVNKINDLTKGFKWNHVPTKENPADIASRGIDPQHLQSCSLWWEGPLFLNKGHAEWPVEFHTISSDNLPEVKILHTVKGDLDNTHSFIKFEIHSNYLKLKRIYSYVLRFLNNCNKNNSKLTGPLNADELNQSLKMLLKFSQAESFPKELSCIKNNIDLNHKSKLLPLNPFMDTEGLIRVGGRLSQSESQYDKKHPILLDAKHHLTKLIIEYEHLRLFHSGPQLLLASVREKFWPLGGRNLARSIAKKCIVCTRFRGQTFQPIMGDLPAVRVSTDFPFNSCGIDFAGPFMIASKKGRGSRVTKAYLCIFVCLATKALHLEVVSDLTTEAFLSCLRRFISRRGKPYAIYCDNGTNFVGANNELKRVIRSSRQTVSDYAATEEIRFIFSPAYSPHFGGIWEAGVKSAKSLFKRVAGNASLTFEELATLFTQIEAILNSRPISPLSSDPTDLNPLTPGHFLIGRPLLSTPSLPVDLTRPNRYQKIEQVRQQFWKRWRLEYMAELQNRTKWRKQQSPIKVGDLVIIKEENVMPLHWTMGRVAHVIPGPDGVCRVADIYTTKGTIRRAVNKLCLLRTSESQEFERR